MASNDRFYQLSGSRPWYWGDLGNRLQLSGFVLSGEDTCALVLSPSMDIDAVEGNEYLVQRHRAENPLGGLVQPTIQEWCAILKETDDPKVFEMDETGFIKAIHRKMQKGLISGEVQQKIWARDGFKCYYCGRMMGEIQLSVDHFEPLEFGGLETQENLISACRKCNKKKGSISAAVWCKKIGISHEGALEYLKQANQKLVGV